jgi:TrmH family RNA methyltransferase
LKENNFIIYSSFIRSKNIIREINFKKRCAILMGTESSSISDFYLKNSHLTFKIPMHGDVDSLNLSVSTSIILYEAMNQRKIY